MAANEPVTSSKKSDTKYFRKLRKCFTIVKKYEETFQTSETPTNNLFIGNGGLTCGFDSEKLYKILNEFGSLKDIILIPDRPYSFVVFEDPEAAHQALLNVNIKSDIILYVAFTTSVPILNQNFQEIVLPPGLKIIENFVHCREEIELLELNSGCNQTLKSRAVQHFGYEFDYSTNNMFGSKPLTKKIPLSCSKIISRMCEQGLVNYVPDQLTVNYYLPGQGIPTHVDTHSAFENEIVSLSLGSQVVMEFRHPSGSRIPVYLPQRSLLVMSGESRYLWSHGIMCRKNDVIPQKTLKGNVQLTLKTRLPRTSLTFRKIRFRPCTCGFATFCDSQDPSTRIESTQSDASLEQLKPETALNLENLHVHQVYENIADHFSETRYKPWPKIDNFLEGIPKGSLLLDIGCGNGKYLGRHPHILEIGCDMSLNLLKICKRRGLEVFETDILAIPLRPGIADAVLCIAVLHHLSTLERRKKALEEISNLLCVGGEALIYVWALEQVGVEGSSNYLKAPSTTSSGSTGPQKPPQEIKEIFESVSLPVHVNRTQFSQQDLLVPWKSGKKIDAEFKVYHRFYHVFKENELDSLVRNVECLDIIESYYDKGNWCLLVKKTKP